MEKNSLCAFFFLCRRCRCLHADHSQVMRMFGAKAPVSKKKPSGETGAGRGLSSAQYDTESNAPVHKQLIDGWNERDRLHR
jgi:hypothetical protein